MATRNTVRFPSGEERRTADVSRQPRQPKPGGTRPHSAKVGEQKREPRKEPSRSPFPHSTRDTGSTNAPRRKTTTATASTGRKTEAKKRPVLSKEEAERRRLAMRRKQKARARHRQILAWLILLSVIGGGIFLSFTLIFRFSSVEVQDWTGQSVESIAGYTAEQLTKGLGLTDKNTIFDFKIKKTEERLEKEFPMLEEVRLIRRYPDTVILQGREAEAAWLVQTEEGWLSVSSALKILAVSPYSMGQKGIELYGGEPLFHTAGEALLYATENIEEDKETKTPPKADERMEAFFVLTEALKEREMLGDITRIEIANVEEIAFLYQNRLNVVLGTLNEIDYKMDYAEYLLHGRNGDGLSETDVGRLDCSHIKDDGTLRVTFKPGESVMPSGYLVGQTQKPVQTVDELLSEGGTIPTEGEEAELYVFVNGKKIPFSELVE